MTTDTEAVRQKGTKTHPPGRSHVSQKHYDIVRGHPFVHLRPHRNTGTGPQEKGHQCITLPLLRAKEDPVKKHTTYLRIVCFFICRYLPRRSHWFDHCLGLEQSREAGLFVAFIVYHTNSYLAGRSDNATEMILQRWALEWHKNWGEA